MTINIESFDFTYGKLIDVYKMMSPAIKRRCRIQQAVVGLSYLVVTALYIALLPLWFTFISQDNVNLPAGEGAQFIALICVLSGPLLGFFLLTRAFRKISMYINYYIPYSLVDDKGRAVIKHYKSSPLGFINSREDLKKYGRIAPDSHAPVFNIPYEYAREHFWAAVYANKKPKNCPMLILPERHEKGLFEKRPKTWVFKCAKDLTQTSTFKELQEKARKIVEG